MSLRALVDDIRQAGAIERILLILLIAFAVLLLMGATIKKGPLVPLIELGNSVQIWINQQLFERANYRPKITVMGLMLLALIPFGIIRGIERRARGGNGQSRH